jgi:hypothetical protein
VGEGGFRAGGKHGRHPFSLPANSLMPKREDPSMQRYEPASPHTVADQAPAEAYIEQLPPRNDPVLTFR